MESEDGEHDPKRQPRTPLEWFNGLTDRNRTRAVREQNIPSSSVVGSDIRGRTVCKARRGADGRLTVAMAAILLPMTAIMLTCIGNSSSSSCWVAIGADDM